MSLKNIPNWKRLTEGVWAVPDTPSKIERLEKAIKQLDRLKDVLHSTYGDDDLFDDIDKVEKKLRDVLRVAKGGKEMMRKAGWLV